MGSFTKFTYHIIFGTKYRKPIIAADISERLYEYMGGTIRSLDGHLIEVGGIEDHIHLLANLPAKSAISDSIGQIKSASSKWMSDHAVNGFEWQKGYSAFTVSYSQIEHVARYIQNQREHHRRQTFQEEYVAFLQRHDIEYDPRYLFEAENHR
jgi:putative transposase